MYSNITVLARINIKIVNEIKYYFVVCNKSLKSVVCFTLLLHLNSDTHIPNAHGNTVG